METKEERIIFLKARIEETAKTLSDFWDEHKTLLEEELVSKWAAQELRDEINDTETIKKNYTKELEELQNEISKDNGQRPRVDEDSSSKTEDNDRTAT